eukprot:g4216.t1
MELNVLRGILKTYDVQKRASLPACTHPGLMHAFRITIPASSGTVVAQNNVTELTQAKMTVSASAGDYKAVTHIINLAQRGAQHSVGRICTIDTGNSPQSSSSSGSSSSLDGSGSLLGTRPSPAPDSSSESSSIGRNADDETDAVIITGVVVGLVAFILLAVACVVVYRQKYGRNASGNVSASGGRLSLRKLRGTGKIKKLKNFNGYTGGAVTVNLDNQGDDSLRPGVSKEQWTKQLVAALGTVSQNIVIDFSTITMGKKIASGGGGQVFVAEWKNAEVVVKEPFWFAGTASQDLINEIQMLSELEHPNVVQFFGVSHANRSVYIVTEYCPLGSLNEWLEQKRFPWDSFYPCGCELLETLQWLHNSGVVHRDIKPHNILMASPKSLKICDLGTCRNQVQGNQSMTANVGTLSYTPPEVMSARRAVYDGRKWDVYSASLVLFYMYTGNRPFGDRSNFQIITGVANKNGLRPQYVDCGIPDELWELLETMWEEDPEDRPLAGDAATWLAKISKQHAGTSALESGGGVQQDASSAHVHTGAAEDLGMAEWRPVYDEVHGQHYYYNESTGESRWTVPDVYGREKSADVEMNSQNNPMFEVQH